MDCNFVYPSCQMWYYKSRTLHVQWLERPKRMEHEHELMIALEWKKYRASEKLPLLGRMCLGQWAGFCWPPFTEGGGTASFSLVRAGSLESSTWSGWMREQRPAWSSWVWVGASEAPGWRNFSMLSPRVRIWEVVRLWHLSESFICKSWGADKMGSPAWCPAFFSSPKLGEGVAILERGHSTGFIQLVRCAAGMWVSLEVKNVTSEYHR